MSGVPEYAVCDSEEDLASVELFAGKGSLPRRLLLSRPFSFGRGAVPRWRRGRLEWHQARRRGARHVTIDGLRQEGRERVHRLACCSSSTPPARCSSPFAATALKTAATVVGLIKNEPFLGGS